MNVCRGYSGATDHRRHCWRGRSRCNPRCGDWHTAVQGLAGGWQPKPAAVSRLRSIHLDPGRDLSAMWCPHEGPMTRALFPASDPWHVSNGRGMFKGNLPFGPTALQHE